MLYFFHGPPTSVVSSGTEDVASTKLPKLSNINTPKDVAKDSKIVPNDNKRSIEVNDLGSPKETHKMLAKQTSENDKND